jgi:hypothetical protein
MPQRHQQAEKRALAEWQYIQEALDLTRKRLGDEEAKQVAKELANNTTLTCSKMETRKQASAYELSHGFISPSPDTRASRLYLETKPRLGFHHGDRTSL